MHSFPAVVYRFHIASFSFFPALSWFSHNSRWNFARVECAEYTALTFTIEPRIDWTTPWTWNVKKRNLRQYLSGTRAILSSPRNMNFGKWFSQAVTKIMTESINTDINRMTTVFSAKHEQVNRRTWPQFSSIDEVVRHFRTLHCGLKVYRVKKAMKTSRWIGNLWNEFARNNQPYTTPLC